jgi:hypothetical protein
MIKFFRKIRQNLLAEGKTSKYLKYAIGEIFLVVIGILIALSINNWNEVLKTQGNQEKYLFLLKAEALNNLKETEKVKEMVHTMHLWQKKLIALIDAPQDTITESYLSKVFSKTLLSTYNIKYENSTLSELKSSGELKNISNDSLRRYLIALEPKVFKVQGQEENVIRSFFEITEFVKIHGSFRRVVDNNELNKLIDVPKSTKIKKNNSSLLSEDEFENRLLHYTGNTSNLLLTHYPILEEHLEKIIALINEDLKQLKK